MTNKEALFIKLPILGKDSEFVPKIAEINAAKTNTSRNWRHLISLSVNYLYYDILEHNIGISPRAK